MIYDDLLFWFDGKQGVNGNRWTPVVDNTGTNIALYSNFPNDGTRYIMNGTSSVNGIWVNPSIRSVTIGNTFTEFFIIDYTSSKSHGWFNCIQSGDNSSYHTFGIGLNNCIEWRWGTSTGTRAYVNEGDRIVSIVATFQNSLLNFYVNGTLISSQTRNLPYPIYIDGTKAIYLGQIYAYDAGYVNASYYSAALYNRALSSSEVAQLHNFYMQYYNLT